MLSLAIFLPVRTSAQTEMSFVFAGQEQASSPVTKVVNSSESAANQSVSVSQNTSGKFIEEYEIFFRFDKTDVDINYLSNEENIASIRHYLANSHRVDSITIYSYASPEGRQKHNQWLSQQRAHAAKEILLKHSPDSAILNSSMIHICPLAENWPGLIREVENRYHRKDRERVLRILKNSNISDDTRKWRLGRLDGGYTWSFLRRIYMPELRVATWVCVWGEIVPPLPILAQPKVQLDAPVTALVLPAFIPQEAPQTKLSRQSKQSTSSDRRRASHPSDDQSASRPSEERSLSRHCEEQSASRHCEEQSASRHCDDQSASRHCEERSDVAISTPVDKSQRTVIGLKTNLLLDAVTALNYAIEVPVNEHFSLQYFQTTPWWTGANNKFCLQALTFGGEARWWFLPRTSGPTENRKQRDALVGHFLGAYGWGGNGDLQFGRKVCQQFDFWSAGLTYGYSMAVSKHLNMEFTLSVGYAAINYQHYVPTDDFSLLVRDDNLAGKLHYIGPTKAEISLVIPIRATVGRKAANKGGDR